MISLGEISSDQWIKEFRLRSKGSRIPISAVLELTSRCNLRCQHCYLGNQDQQHLKRSLERNTEAVKASLKEWADAGSLYLLITGGDPMMRKDFPEIYRYARELGLLVTVFCDGILINDRILELFKELPPRKVEISIYGATEETYEKVTRVPGSHAKAWVGIHKLLDHGIRIGLKTVLMTLNQHELDAMNKQAEDLGIPFRYDAAIFPCLPGNAGNPLDLRVSPSFVVDQDIATPERRAMWKKTIARATSAPESESLYTCGAGATAFYADPFGNLSPCLLTTHYRYRQDGRSFQDVWNNDIIEIRKKKKTCSDNSFTGKYRGACNHCPAFNYLETGNEEQESEYIKETVKLRYQAIMETTT